MLIDVAISGDTNVIKKDEEEILKYKDLTTEIQRKWNVKTKVIPVIIGATGTISKSFRKYVSNIPGNNEIKELQKTSILGTAHILRRVLMWRYNGVNAVTSYIRTMNSYIRIVATRFP
jgi:chorismate mutase